MIVCPQCGKRLVLRLIYDVHVHICRECGYTQPAALTDREIAS
jgi:DNA-directed RNA polymerase subunit M/transcription elongation factor TFIIS